MTTIISLRGDVGAIIFFTPYHIYLKCLYQARKASSWSCIRVLDYRFWLVLPFHHYIFFFFLFFFHWILIYILLQHGMSFSFLTEISKLGKPEYPGKTTHREFPKFPDQLSSITASYREDLTHNIRKVWRYQKCDHSEFKEEHTIQWSKEKQTMVEQHKTH